MRLLLAKEEQHDSHLLPVNPHPNLPFENVPRPNVFPRVYFSILFGIGEWEWWTGR